jgi:uncharacterized cofD-like protein
MFAKVVVIGGGTGNFSLLRGLKYYKPLKLTAVVSMMDDGGSTGLLRSEFGILPPGDIRQCMIALSEESELIQKLFGHRFNGSLGDHSFGNLFHLALSQITGNEEAAILEMSKLLKISGKVVPVTLESVCLKAELEDGSIVSGETNIDLPKHNADLQIAKLYIEPSAKVNPKATSAIERADCIIIAPGDLYTSTLPNFLVPGIPEAIAGSKALRIYVCNLMTKHGETTGFSAADHIRVLHHYLGRNCIDLTIVNNRKPSAEKAAEYSEEKSFPVEYDVASIQAQGVGQVVEADVMSKKTLIRHDPMKVAWELIKIIQEHIS